MFSMIISGFGVCSLGFIVKRLWQLCVPHPPTLPPLTLLYNHTYFRRDFRFVPIGATATTIVARRSIIGSTLTLAPDTRLAVEALLLGVAFDITCTRYFDIYLSSESDSPELVPTDEGTDPGVVTGVLVHELRVGDLLGVLMGSLVDARRVDSRVGGALTDSVVDARGVDSRVGGVLSDSVVDARGVDSRVGGVLTDSVVDP